MTAGEAGRSGSQAAAWPPPAADPDVALAGEATQIVVSMRIVALDVKRLNRVADRARTCKAHPMTE